MTFPRAFSLLMLTAGCTADRTAYPSLAPRAVERASFDEPAVAPPAPMVADPALDAQLRALDAKLSVVVKGFDADAERAQAAAAVSGARRVGSEPWLSAQQALAALDDWRAQASGLASETAELAAERASTIGTPYAALDAAQARATAEADRQAAVIARIAAALPTS